MRRPDPEGRIGAARLLTALAVPLLPVAVAGIGAGNGGLGLAVGGARVAVGLDTLQGATTVAAAAVVVRKLQTEADVEECTDDTSVGDAEAGIAIYYDEEACNREDPEVGCNGECSRKQICR